ncbi:hypothetical protein B0H14DRAFT_2628349 [Mycena olivaceomarginata]|nr:hypothetical protein B0H14DRAFT_2628349 [Mycena olivaceomarginata]
MGPRSRKFRAEATRARMESIRGPVAAVLELCNFEMKAQARDEKAKSSVFRRKIPTVAEDTDCTALQSAWCHLRTTVEQRQDLSPEKKITDVYATTKEKWNSYGERHRIILARATVRSPGSRVRAKLVRVWERCKNGGARQNSKAGACQWAEPNPGSRERSHKKSKANAVELRWSAGYENAGRKRPVEMTAHGWTASTSTSTIQGVWQDVKPRLSGLTGIVPQNAEAAERQKKRNYTHLPKDFLTSNLAFPDGRQAVRAGIDSFRADYLQNKMQGGKGWRDVGYRRFCVLTLNAVRQGLEFLRPMGLIAFPFLSHFQHGFFPSISEPARYVALPSSSSLANELQ